MNTPTLKDLSLVPPEGFWFKQPETGVKLDGGSLNGTAQKVVLHRQANSLPRQDYKEAMEDIQTQICQRVPSSLCHNCNHPDWKFDAASLIRGGEALITYAKEKLTGGNPFVSQDEADARAARCANCFHNRNLGGCGFGCTLGEKLREMFGYTIGERVTKSDEKLQACEICGCHARTIAWYRLDIVNAGISDAQKQAFTETPYCWRA
jgi:hypothetical protein